jgi:hypothetical protein
MIEGRGSDDGFATVRRLAHARPDLMDRLIDVVARAAPLGSVVAVEGDTALDPLDLPVGPWESRPVPPAILHFWRPAQAPPQ